MVSESGAFEPDIIQSYDSTKENKRKQPFFEGAAKRGGGNRNVDNVDNLPIGYHSIMPK